MWSNLLSEVPDLVSRLAHTLGDRVNHELKNRGIKKAEALAEAEAAAELPKKEE
jgi:hypothetical protein